MKVYLSVLCVNLIGLCFFAVTTWAEPEKNGVDKWIDDLASETFQVREKASQELWKLGELALPALREALLSNDPEVAMRVREAIYKVELRINEDTSPRILSLIESYKKASSAQKLGLLNELREEKAYFQLLKLFRWKILRSRENWHQWCRMLQCMWRGRQLLQMMSSRRLSC